MRKTLSIVFGVLVIISGIYCMTSPGLTFLTLGYIIGLVMVYDGIGRIINWAQLREGIPTISTGYMLAVPIQRICGITCIVRLEITTSTSS